MHNSKRSGSFFPCLFINMLMNIEGLMPAVILLVLHFWLKISVCWSVGAFIAWILSVIRTAKPKDNDSGGSSTHTSSSGSTHGGGGGKF